MSKVVYKYSLRHRVEMPIGAQILTIQMQDNQPMIWALVDPNAQFELRHFEAVSTGYSVGNGLQYIGTYFEGQFVWHVFEY